MEIVPLPYIKVYPPDYFTMDKKYVFYKGTLYLKELVYK